MRLLPVLCLLALLAPAALAASDDDAILAAEGAVLDATLSSSIRLVPRQHSPTLEYVLADLYFYPREGDGLAVLDTSTSPAADFNGSRYRFEWRDAGSLAYRLDARLEVSSLSRRILSKVPYPLPHVPDEARPFLEPGKSIDSGHPAIKAQALRLAEGEDDLFLLAVKVAHWVKSNVYYNLSTLTAEASQTASWVLENRIGVCDELTALFIAMLRSLGIPAKYVSGISYTNSPLFPERWGAHGWAEVYFPGTGWVPFDPTFGEYGGIDPGHVKMFEGIGTGGVSTRFEWRATGYDIEPQPLDTDASIRSITPSRRVLDVDVRVAEDEVGFGSHNLVTATVRNLLDAYTAAELVLARVEGMESIDPQEQPVALRPGESRTLAWRVRVPSSLSRRFVYTFPIVVSARASNASTSFTAREDGRILDRDAVDALHEDLAAPVAPRLELGCVPTKAALYPGESASVACEIRNRGDALSDVTVCLASACKDVGVSRDGRAAVELPVAFTEPGRRTLAVTAQAGGISARALVAIDMDDFPAVAIMDITAPRRVRYDEAFTLSFLLRRTSHSQPLDVQGQLAVGRATAPFTVASLANDRLLTLDLPGSRLRPGNNTVTVTVSFKDRNGKSYEARETAVVELAGVTFWQRVLLLLRSLLGG